MLSHGSINGSPMASYPLAGGGFVIDVDGNARVAADTFGRAVARRLATSVAPVAIMGRLITGIMSSVDIGIHASVNISVRRMATGSTTSRIAASGRALRRPIAKSTVLVALLTTAAAGYSYMRPTARARRYAVTEQRNTSIVAENRLFPIRSDDRRIVVPRERELS